LKEKDAEVRAKNGKASITPLYLAEVSLRLSGVGDAER